MPYSYTLSTFIPASPEEVYAAWLDSEAHTAMTGGKAEMSDEVDVAVSAWDGYITGRNLELVPHERIVQSWRTTQFGPEHQDSIVTLTLDEVDGGTQLTLEHSNVPDAQTSYEQGGWQTHYFEPMQKHFARRKAKPAAKKAMKKKAAPKKAAKPKRRAAAAARKRVVKAKAKPKRRAPKRKTGAPPKKKAKKAKKKR